MATKAASLARELKSIKSDLCFVQERCALLEEENRRLRDGFAKGIRPEEDDLVLGFIAYLNLNYASVSQFFFLIDSEHNQSLEHDKSILGPKGKDNAFVYGSGNYRDVQINPHMMQFDLVLLGSDSFTHKKRKSARLELLTEFELENAMCQFLKLLASISTCCNQTLSAGKEKAEKEKNLQA